MPCTLSLQDFKQHSSSTSSSSQQQHSSQQQLPAMETVTCHYRNLISYALSTHANDFAIQRLPLEFEGSSKSPFRKRLAVPWPNLLQLCSVGHRITTVCQQATCQSQQRGREAFSSSLDDSRVNIAECGSVQRVGKKQWESIGRKLPFQHAHLPACMYARVRVVMNEQGYNNGYKGRPQRCCCSNYSLAQSN